jgi:hypothetical protein
MPGCQTTAGCQCRNRADMTAWPAQIARDAAIPIDSSPMFAAGRLAGIREAADAIVAQIQAPYTGTRTDDFMDGWAQGANATAERNRSAILALAGGER